MSKTLKITKKQLTMILSLIVHEFCNINDYRNYEYLIKDKIEEIIDNELRDE